MNLAVLSQKLNLRVRSGEHVLNREVSGGYVGDLLSDVIANSKKNDVWITCQLHPNIIAVSALKEHAGIILVLGKEPGRETLESASREEIPVLVTTLSGFEVAGRIYNLIKE